MKSTFNEIYMGSDVDYKGDKLEIVTASLGQKVNKVTVEHHKQFETKCHKICDGVYQSVGYGMSNVCMIEGNTGMIIVDSNNSNEAAELNLEHFRQYCDKPVSAIIYSHSHYCNGTVTFAKAAASSELEIWGHQDHVKNMLEMYTEFYPWAYRRNAINNGMMCPPDGELGRVDCGLGPCYVYPGLKGFTIGWIPPNKLISDDKVTKATIDGIDFEFYPAYSESSDSIITYIPEKKCALTNHAWPVFANLYTLRGEYGRDPKDWIYSIDVLRELKVHHVGGCHGVPISGEEKVYEVMTHYRDAIQYLYNQTIKGMNEGKDPDEILKDFEMPGYFTNGQITKECYGEVEYYVRGIYRTFIGWFGWDPVELHPVTKEFEAERLVQLMGGESAVLLEADKAFKNKEFSWAAQLATYILKVNPEQKDAKLIKAGSFQEMAIRTPAAHTRSWYTVGAACLTSDEYNFFKMKSRPDMNMVGGLPAEMWIKVMPTNLIPAKAKEIKKTVAFHLTDTNVKCGFYMRPYVAEFSTEIKNPDVEIVCDSGAIRDLVAGIKSYENLVVSKEITFKGDAKFGEIFGTLFDF